MMARAIIRSMSVYRLSILIDASPERVFAFWTDLDRLPLWVGGVTRVTDLTGPIDQPGTRYAVWFGRMRSQTEILEVERPAHIRTRFGNVVLKGESDVTFQARDGGTLLTQEFRTRGVVSAIFARLFATGSWQGSFRGELETFRRIVEQQDRAGRP